jgi:hypothetical protein
VTTRYTVTLLQEAVADLRRLEDFAIERELASNRIRVQRDGALAQVVKIEQPPVREILCIRQVQGMRE